jgi:hypothetical protein
MTSPSPFSAAYPEARAKFLAAAKAAGAALDRITNPNLGPDGGDLSTDVAWIGPREASRVLVLLSGTHGVEGFCGSGAQVDWLTRGEHALMGPDTAALLVHAVNPYGFAWLRRVTEENVDLNRNWVDFNPGYEDLSEALCPSDWSEQTQSQTKAQLIGWARDHGFPQLQQAATGGQYRHPHGVFYGGEGPTWARRTQTAIYESYLGKAARVAIIDYHTGLGDWGFGEHIISARKSDALYRRALSWYGAGITSHLEGTSTSAVMTGDGLDAAPVLLADAEVTGMALEFGTQPGAVVLDALRADAWLHRHGDVQGPQAQLIKRQIRDAFYGDAEDWKGMILGQSLTACRNALAGLAG